VHTTSAVPRTLTLAFAGDLNFDRQLESVLDRPAPLVSALRPVLSGADLSMLNLETAITTRGTPEPKTYHFRAPAGALDVVASTGVDVVTMANNHAVDYGLEGFSDTLAASQHSPIPVVGIGHNAAEAFAPAVFHLHGVSVAVLGSTEIDDLTLNKFPATDSTPGVATNLEPSRLLAAVRAAARTFDVVVVYLHWGLDYTSCPDDIQPSMAARLSAAGADIVVGSHAHRVEGGGWLGDSYVDYGLGNFVWSRNDGDNGVSGVLTLSIDVPRVLARRDAAAGDRSGRSVVTRAEWTPLLIGDDGIPREPDAALSAELSRRWGEARSCTGLSARSH
jgi:poly-gamma-glutamate capsule biosynthesis protein CapA/YwtB (metallophosphatase superfamily)